MIKTNNADINKQMIIDNENKNLLISQKIEEQNKSETEFAEKINQVLIYFYVITTKTMATTAKEGSQSELLNYENNEKPI